MPLGRSDLADFSTFLAIAKHRNFRLAGLELGVSASALSHALKGLEARLGVRLLNRTNRSVTLTSAGEALRDAITGPFDAIAQAAEDLNRHRAAPAGRIRLNILSDAAPLLLGPVLPVFAERYPEIEVEVAVSNRMLDVVGEGFDAGIRHGGTVPVDMIAQPLSAEMRWMVAASPGYIERHGRPLRPEDLRHHHCLGVRLGDDRLYRWEFMGPEGEFSLQVPSKLTFDDGRTMLPLALSGTGLMYGAEPFLAPYVARGELEFVLEDWATRGPGYHIYYPGRRQLPTGLRLLIDLFRELRPLGL